MDPLTYCNSPGVSLICLILCPIRYLSSPTLSTRDAWIRDLNYAQTTCFVLQQPASLLNSQTTRFAENEVNSSRLIKGAGILEQ